MTEKIEVRCLCLCVSLTCFFCVQSNLYLFWRHCQYTADHMLSSIQRLKVNCVSHKILDVFLVRNKPKVLVSSLAFLCVSAFASLQDFFFFLFFLIPLSQPCHGNSPVILSCHWLTEEGEGKWREEEKIKKRQKERRRGGWSERKREEHITACSVSSDPRPHVRTPCLHWPEPTNPHTGDVDFNTRS